MTKEIILSNGQVTLVSDEDYDYLNQFNWSPMGGRGQKYPARKENNVNIYLHHLVLIRAGVVIPYGMEPDHLDRNTFNNQRNNLEVKTKSQNRHNTNTQHNNLSGCRGVNYNQRTGRWVARLSINGYRISLGTFSTLEEAIAARKQAEVRHLT